MTFKSCPTLDHVLVSDLLPGDVILTSGFHCHALVVSISWRTSTSSHSVFMVNEYGRVLKRMWVGENSVALLLRSSNCAP